MFYVVYARHVLVCVLCIFYVLEIHFLCLRKNIYTGVVPAPGLMCSASRFETACLQCQ